MPDLNQLAKAYADMGCDLKTITQRMESKGLPTDDPGNVQKEMSECIKLFKEQEKVEHEQFTQQQSHHTAVTASAYGAVIFLVLLLFLLRQPLRRVLEKLFILSASKIITTRKNLVAYRRDMSQQVKDRVDGR